MQRSSVRASASAPASNSKRTTSWAALKRLDLHGYEEYIGLGDNKTKAFVRNI